LEQQEHFCFCVFFLFLFSSASTMKSSAILVACLASCVSANGNASLPMMYTEEELEEKRKNMVLMEELFEQSNGASTCSNDMRSSFPGCHQSGEMWCWATSVASVEEFYNGRTGDQCKGVECQVVSFTTGNDCCPFKSRTDECGERGGTVREITKAIQHFSGRSFTIAGGPLSEATLSAALQGGNPVILEVGNDKAPNHIMTLHGCDGSGNYWLHDPEREYGDFVKGDYNWLIHGMCRAWVDRSNARLVACEGDKNPDEIFRVTTKWWDTIYVPAGVTV